MTKQWKAIKGVKWFKDIVNDPNRKFGIEIHEHIPAETVTMERLGYDSMIRRPQENGMLQDLAEYYGEFPTQRTFPEAYAATIENGTIIGNSGMIITPDGYLIAETASMVGFQDGRCLTIDNIKKDINLSYKGHFNGNLLSAANPNYGYGHHFIESLISVLWFDGVDIDCINVAEGKNYDRMVEFLEPLGIPKDALLQNKPTEFLSADRVSFFAPCTWFFYPRRAILDMVENRLVAPRRSKIPPSKKIFKIVGQNISGANRAVEAQETIMPFLKEQGFECIDPATLNFLEKIDYFSQAQFVINQDANAEFFAPTNNTKFGLVNFSHIGNLTQTQGFELNYQQHITTSPPSIIYPDFCTNNGYFLATNGIMSRNCQRIMSVQYPNRIYGDIASQVPKTYSGPLAYTVDLKKFEEFFKLLDEA